MCLLLLFIYGLQVSQQLSLFICIFIYMCIYKKKGTTHHTYTKLFLREFEQLDPAAKATVSLEESQTTLNVIVGVFFLLG